MDPAVTIRNYRRKKKRCERDSTIQRAFQDNELATHYRKEPALISKDYFHAI